MSWSNTDWKTIYGVYVQVGRIVVLLDVGFMRHQRDVLCPWHLTWLSFISSVQTVSSCTLQGVLRQTSLSETCSKSLYY